MAPWEKQTNRRQLLELKVPNYDNSCSYGTKLNVIFYEEDAVCLFVFLLIIKSVLEPYL